MHAEQLEQWLEEIETLMAERLRLRKPTLSGQMHKAGRLLPRNIRRDMTRLIEADLQGQHPKLARQMDESGLKTAHGRIVVYLKTLDPKQRRKDRLLNMAALLAANFLLAFILLVVLLRWRGLV